MYLRGLHTLALFAHLLSVLFSESSYSFMGLTLCFLARMCLSLLSAGLEHCHNTPRGNKAKVMSSRVMAHGPFAG